MYYVQSYNFDLTILERGGFDKNGIYIPPISEYHLHTCEWNGFTPFVIALMWIEIIITVLHNILLSVGGVNVEVVLDVTRKNVIVSWYRFLEKILFYPYNKIILCLKM